ncbi:conserved hypothetical protein [Streptomyces viridochromogenes DSM 40736]|uniref:Uncharacterized protein n=1 Tax=Streptomyces viridochromogenes (strain DSM 40736 / JCM 4977 / BCRC 1201 / Tue 494) TaxID=591159 RepID=D9X6V6_STRVT|nr:DUF6087 family protein [Streptomyces viridochromogenes]EFL34023.1 conserved hypothetical protein [Streptomyces viridochromogenes DSM 40736]
MDDESLKDWAERRDAMIGRLRAVPVMPGDGPRASHLNPDAPRAIERWNGHAWELYGFAASLADAKAILYPEANEPSSLRPMAKPLGSGSGKHRKPQAPRPDGGGRTQR